MTDEEIRLQESDVWVDGMDGFTLALNGLCAFLFFLLFFSLYKMATAWSNEDSNLNNAEEGKSVGMFRK